jgi:NAD(P)-dependent dehydrogenase (short-subunit alcohol dehydrogenase family)
MTSSDLQGKVAFITGGASGIGFGMAKAFSAAGMRVAIADVEQSALDRAKAELHQTRADSIAVQVDVTDRDAMEEAAQRTEAAFGRVHVVCNNAGVSSAGLLDEVTYDDWDWTLGVNLGGVVNGVQTFLKRIKSHGEGGHIVNTASMAGLIGPLADKGGIYRVSKFAVVALTESLRYDLAPHGISASVLCPGLINTNIASSERNRPVRFGQGPSESPEEAARAARFAEALTGAMEPAEVGEKVLEGIRRNQLYILTHPEWKPFVERRNRKLDEAFGTPDPDKVEALFDTFRWLARG